MSMEADLTKIRLAREVSLVLRRGNTNLSAQSARFEIAGARAFQMMSDAAREARQAGFLLMAVSADVEREDRFTINGQVYRVAFVQPNRTAATIAECVLVQ